MHQLITHFQCNSSTYTCMQVAVWFVKLHGWHHDELPAAGSARNMSSKLIRPSVRKDCRKVMSRDVCLISKNLSCGSIRWILNSMSMQVLSSYFTRNINVSLWKIGHMVHMLRFSISMQYVTWLEYMHSTKG